MKEITKELEKIYNDLNKWGLQSDQITSIFIRHLTILSGKIKAEINKQKVERLIKEISILAGYTNKQVEKALKKLYKNLNIPIESSPDNWANDYLTINSGLSSDNYLWYYDGVQELLISLDNLEVLEDGEGLIYRD